MFQARNLVTNQDVTVSNNPAPVAGSSADINVPSPSGDDSDDDGDASGESINLFAFTFDDTTQPARLLWDPEIGAADASGGYDSPASTVSVSVAVLTTLLALIMAMFAF
jgi:hypothetical protein